ncbi:MAG: nucleotidyltransferase domain-containing protein [Pseudomonadota bacterium]|nr:nucleotidyltransferase domain-containing protein [Pseudomonadota bacterium]
MDRFFPLSATAQTAYAQLLDAVHGAELTRSVASLRGTFARKQVKGRTYWYFQYTEVSGKVRQLYVGPQDARVQALMEAHASGGPAQAVELLARSALALGNAPVLARHFKVVQRLADYGFFRAGGVLIGTHAFLAFGNMLGVRWQDGSRTQDVDFAHAGKTLAIALPANIEIDTHAAIESLQMGLLPIEHADGGRGATYLDPRDPEFQLDFLTPLHRGGMQPYRHPQLGIALQPLKFMEYLLQDVQQAALLSASGAVLVSVPHPARYALHKLIVAGERPASRIAKSNKDIQQVAALLSVLREQARWQVDEAWTDLTARGPGWLSRAQRGREALGKVAPELEVATWLPVPTAKPGAHSPA